MFKSHHIVAKRMIAGSQRTMGAGYLVDVAIVFEQVKRLVSQLQIASMVG